MCITFIRIPQSIGSISQSVRLHIPLFLELTMNDRQHEYGYFYKQLEKFLDDITLPFVKVEQRQVKRTPL